MSPILKGILASGISGNLAAPNSFDSIATLTGNGSSATMTFSSIPSTYTHLQLRFSLGSTGPTGAAIYGGWLQFNGDTATNYNFHYLYSDGTSVSSGAVLNNGNAGSITYATASATNVLSGGVLDILDYTNTNKYKTVRSLTGGDLNGGGNINFYSGNWRSTTAINSITLSLNTGFGAFAFSTTSKVALYGIKG